jgi:3,4-dihydroxy-2-butanone 4-phosphate synthase
LIRTGTVEEALAAVRTGRPVLVADDADNREVDIVAKYVERLVQH